MRREIRYFGEMFSGMDKLAIVGRIVFAFCIVMFGVEQLLFHEFLAIFVPRWPEWMPGHYFWLYILSILLVVFGLAIILRPKSQTAALMLGVFLLLLLIFAQMPFQLLLPAHSLLERGDAFTVLALAGSAFIVGDSMVARRSKRLRDPRWVLFGRICLSILLVFFGVEHFFYTRFVASLIPGWIPGANFWSYLCGLALVGAGGAILFGYRLRQVALLLGIMFILLAFLLHIPRVLADPYSVLGGESSSVFQALSFGGAAFVLAAWSRPTRATSTTPRAAAQ
jgi:uncharacterized membrane protein YphA (DoxX/SURF4 family)